MNLFYTHIDLYVYTHHIDIMFVRMQQNIIDQIVLVVTVGAFSAWHAESLGRGMLTPCFECKRGGACIPVIRISCL